MSSSMRVVRIREPGGPEVLQIREVPVPDPGRGQIRVRVRAAGVNRADLLQRLGRYPAPAGYPADIPGLEYAGEVEALGPGAPAALEGERVMGITGGGAYAECLVVDAETAVRIPVGLGTAEAAAVPEAFMTAFDAVLLQAGLRGGETLLVHAVGSGVGTAAVQLARRAGAHVVGTSRTADKLDRARELGLEAGVLIARADARHGASEPGAGGQGGAGGGSAPAWVEEVRRAAGRWGVDVILDLVGAPYLAGNQRVLAERGRHMVVGVPGGATEAIDLGLLMRSRATIRGTVLRARPTAEKAALARAFERDVLPGFVDGTLRAVVDRVFPAEEAGAAHALMEANRNFGKILLTW